MPNQNPVIRGTDVVLEAGRKFTGSSESGFAVEGSDPRLRGVLIDTIANRPAATSYGVGWFLASDLLAFYWSDGATWSILSEVPQSGLHANRPAASADLVGKMWFSTDTVALYICSSAPAWVAIPIGGGGAPALHAGTHSLGGTDVINTPMDGRAYPINQGILAARPVPSTYGVGLWYATDLKTIYKSDGVLTWSVLVSEAETGVAASRPAATADRVGKFYFATDTGQLSIVTSAPAWVNVAPTVLHHISHEPGGSDALTALDNSSIKALAGIVYSKLTLTGSIVNADVAAAAAIAYAKLALTGSIVNADVAAAAAIAYSKLALTGALVNADINAAAAIAYSKLNLAASIVNADVAAAAAIAYSKLALSGSIKDGDLDVSVIANRLSGDELTYNQFTAGVAISATTEATANSIIAASSFTHSNTQAIIAEFCCVGVQGGVGAGGIQFVLWDDTAGVSLGLLSAMIPVASGAIIAPVTLQKRFTPSASGARVYSIRAFRLTVNQTVLAGAGGAGAQMPGYLRLIKA